MKTVAILQSNYIPWKGYFDIISRVDEFVLYDQVQYTKNDWRNRNQIKTSQGKIWLTIPVNHKSLGQRIDETRISDTKCFAKHWRSFCQSYAKAPFLHYCREHLEALFLEGPSSTSLSENNAVLIKAICDLLDIRTRITDSTAYELQGDRNQRLVNLCKQADATCYLSGPAAQSYLDEQAFADEGISVTWMDYGSYREYNQPHPPFDHGVSILDLIASTGPEARSFLLHNGR
jgi:hypothetical protein